MGTELNQLVEYKDIFDNQNTSNWFKILALKEPLAFVTLIGDNRQNFKRIFGHQSGNKGDTLYWEIAEQGLSFVITSNATKSTYLVKYIGSDEQFETNFKTGSYLIVFMQKILENISS